MKYTLILILLFSLAVSGCKAKSHPQQDYPESENVATQEDTHAETWLTNYDSALAQAKERNLPVLINFSGSDWCIWCIRLDNEVLTKPEFLSYAKENLVLLNLDFPRQTKLPADQAKANEEIAGRYGIRGFPTILLLDSDGKQIGQTGYQAGGPEKYVAHLKDILAKAK